MIKKLKLEPNKWILYFAVMLTVISISLIPKTANANVFPAPYRLTGTEPITIWTPNSGGSVVSVNMYGYQALWGGAVSSFSFYTDINVSGIATTIDIGQVYATASVEQANYSGDKDTGAMTIDFYSANNTILGSATTGNNDYNSEYSYVELTEEPVPVGTRYIRYTLSGLRAKGSDCDAYFKNPKFSVADFSAPAITDIQCDTPVGTYKVGDTINYTIKFSEPISVLNTRLIFNLNAQANSSYMTVFNSYNAAKDTAYCSLKIGTTLFDVFSGQRVNSFELLPNAFMVGSYVTDVSGNKTMFDSNTLTDYISNLSGRKFDFKTPNITQISSNASLGKSYWTVGETLTFTLTFDEPIKFSTAPKLNFSNGKSALYTPFPMDGDSKLSFSYTIAQGDDSQAFLVSSFADGGITDLMGNILTSNAVNISTLYDIKIDTLQPAITFSVLNDTMINALERSQIGVLTTSATDYSGIDKMYYVWSNTATTPSFAGVAQAHFVATETVTTTLPTTTGIYYLFTKAVDFSGKETIAKSPYTYSLDLVGPTIASTIEYVPSTTNVKSIILNSSDDLSGTAVNYTGTTKSMYYTWKLNGTSYVYSDGYANNGDSIPLPTVAGVYSLTALARDIAGNYKSTSFENLIIPAPIVIVNIGISPVSSYAYQKSYSINVNITAANVTNRAYYWGTSSVASTNIENIISGCPQIASNNAVILSTSNATQLNGTQYLHIYVKNASGQYFIQSAGPFNFDNSAPYVLISPNGTINTAIKDRYIVNLLAMNDNWTPVDQIVKKYVVSADETCPKDLLQPFTGTSINVDVVSGQKYLYVSLTDSAGNESIQKSNAFSPKNAKPTGSIGYAGQYMFTSTNTANASFYATNSDNYKMQAMYEVDGILTDWEDIVVSDTYAKQFTFSAVYGNHVIRVKYRTETGVESDFYGTTFYYDNIAPEITISADRTDPMTGVVTLTAKVTDDPVYSNHYLYCDWLTPRVVQTDSNGVFTFKAKDPVGNIITKTYTVSNIDKQAPKVIFTSNEYDALPHKTANINIAVTDDILVSSATYTVGTLQNTIIQIQPINGNADIILDSRYPDGAYYIVVEAIDAVGRSVRIVSNYIYLDNTPIESYITYSTNKATPNSVVAYLQSYDDDIMTVTNNGGSPIYTFADNGSFTFEYRDSAGNIATKTAQVNWIDKSLDSITYTVTTESGEIANGYIPTNHNLIVTLYPTVSDTVKIVTFNNYMFVNNDEIEKIGNDNEYKYLVKKGGTFRYNLFADGGGTGSGIVLNIDKNTPTLRTIIYSNTNPTDKDVVATIYANDSTGVRYEPSQTITFTENGTKQVKVYDQAGNMATFEMTVNNIYKDMPIPVLTYTVDGQSYDPANYTTKRPMVTLTFLNAEQNPVRILNNSAKNAYLFGTNESFEFLFEDSVGKTGSIVATISKFDVNPPAGTIAYSTIKTTNGKVTATLTTIDNLSDDITITNNNGSNIYEFTQNGEFIFEFKDEAGNIGHATASVANIDATELTLTYSVYAPEGEKLMSVSIDVNANRPVRPVGSPSWASYVDTFRYYIFNNGTYNYEYEDIYGHRASVEVVVTQIFEAPFNVILEYSTIQTTSSDVVVTLRTENPFQSLMVKNNDGKFNYRFTQNGEFTFVYSDSKGREYSKTAVVNNIDKAKANITVTYSTIQTTTADIIVILTADKDVIFPSGIAKIDNRTGKFYFKSNGKLLIDVKDNSNNITRVTLEVENIDRDAPVIRFDKETESIPSGCEFNFLSGVNATDYSELDGAITYTHNIDFYKLGDYIITYFAKDKAGNIAQKTKKVSVYNANLFSAFVNGEKVKNLTIVLNTRTINMTTINQGDNVKYKLLKGKKIKGDFKANGTFITQQYTFAESGLYTILVSDDEMNSQIINLAIN